MLIPKVYCHFCDMRVPLHRSMPISCDRLLHFSTTSFSSLSRPRHFTYPHSSSDATSARTAMILSTDCERVGGRIVSGKVEDESIAVDLLFRETLPDETPWCLLPGRRELAKGKVRRLFFFFELLGIRSYGLVFTLLWFTSVTINGVQRSGIKASGCLYQLFVRPSKE